MLIQPVSPKAKVVGRLRPRITRELKRVSSLRWNMERMKIKMDCYCVDVPRYPILHKTKKTNKEKMDVPSIRSSTFHGLLVSPRDDGFRCDQFNLDTHIGNASAVKSNESPALIWVWWSWYKKKKKKKKNRRKKKTKEKGKTGKKTVRAAGENGAHLTLIGQDSCSSKLQSSLRFISTLFPFNLIPPLYICFSIPIYLF